MRFCKDCKHATIKPGLSLEFAQCYHPKTSETHPEYLVTGEGDKVSALFCAAVRVGPLCGLDARLFEPKENANG